MSEVLAGGGSEHLPLGWMLADILNRELLTIDTPAAFARGAALLGGIASGVWSDAMETARLAPDASLVVAPDGERAAVYGRYVEGMNR